MSFQETAAALLASLFLLAFGDADVHAVSGSRLECMIPGASLARSMDMDAVAATDLAMRTSLSGEEHHEHEDQGLFSVLRETQLTTGLIVSALLLALGLGALHALSPGHGKALVAAYLVGTRGTIGHAIALGGIVTFTHIFSVLVLGLIALIAADYLVPEKLAPVLGIISGVLIVGVGLFMFRRAFRSTHHGHHVHEGDADPSPDRFREVSLGSLVALGVSGGLVPCPSALVVLLTAIALGRIGLGLALVVAFSFGLALVLMAIGVLLVTMQEFMERLGGGGFVQRAGATLPLVSATIVTAVGLVISWRSFVDIERTLL